jgi:hypothetical protein
MVADQGVRHEAQQSDDEENRTERDSSSFSRHGSRFPDRADK